MALTLKQKQDLANDWCIVNADFINENKKDRPKLRMCFLNYIDYLCKSDLISQEDYQNFDYNPFSDGNFDKTLAFIEDYL